MRISMKRHKHIPESGGLRPVGWKRLCGLAVALLFGLFWGAASAAPAIGERPPQALGYDRHGEALNLADARGRVVVVTFWASWCTPCLDEMAVLENLQKRIGGERLLVVAVNWREDLFQYRASLRRLAQVQIRLSRDESESVAQAYGVDTLPRTFVIAGDGRLAFDNRGFESPQDAVRLARQINKLLDAAGTPPRAIISP
jgi:thiol-disulfide isomerase/thioredoxin